MRPHFTGKIVMVSARSSVGDQASGHGAGADLYLTKPFRPRELKQKFVDLMSPAEAG